MPRNRASEGWKPLLMQKAKVNRAVAQGASETVERIARMGAAVAV